MYIPGLLRVFCPNALNGTAGTGLIDGIECSDVDVQMSGSFAIIDATGLGSRTPAETEVAGLEMLERTLRLAEVSGCRRGLVWVPRRVRDRAERIIRRLHDDDRWEMRVELRETTGDTAPVLAPEDVETDLRRVLFLDATFAYERGLVEECLSRADERGGVWTARREGERARLVASDHRGWTRLAEAEGDSGRSVFELVDDPDSLVRGPEVRAVHADDDWIVEVDGEAAAERAANHIWRGCYKSLDGPVSRHLNRPVSVAISRRLAPTGIRPNHMSAVTFAVGLAAAAAGAAGGFWWFLLAGVLYQATSILDGVDGELARAKYEFSFVGEWVDTLCDNFKDIIFYLGVGYGASTTVPFAVAGASGEVWMWLGGFAALGKFLSLAGYSVWMIPRGTGCPLYFDWGDDEATSRPADGHVDRATAVFRVLGKNDVVLFAAFAMSTVGLLPWFLLIVAVGHHVVAFGIANRLVELSREPETSAEPPETAA